MIDPDRSSRGSSASTDADRPTLRGPLQPLIVVGIVVAVMWAAEIVDIVPGTEFDRWGIRPRTTRGLLGIPLAPFLHSGFGHLFANTIPFLVLGTVIALGDIARFVRVAAIVGATSGLGTWLFAASFSIHLGASGLVFGFLTYLVARGVFAHNVWWLLGGLVVLVFYGGILWGLLPRPGVSWTGHVFGAVGGVLAAYVIHAPRGEPEPGVVP